MLFGCQILTGHIGLLAIVENHGPVIIVGKGVIKELRESHPEANIIAVDYDPGASEVNQLNRIKLMLATAQKQLHTESNKAIS